MTFVDVGAHHGLFSVIAAKQVGAPGNVVSFEPSSRDRRRLRLNQLLNRANRIRIAPFALGAVSGRTSFFVVQSGYTTMNSLRPPAVDTPVEEVQVDMVTLDEYVSRCTLPEIDFIKIDAEGAEMDIFSGAALTIKRLRPLILCEVLDSVSKPWGRSGVQSIDHLETLGYRWFEFLENGLLRSHDRRREYPEVRNYLAVPHEKLSTLEALISVH